MPEARALTARTMSYLKKLTPPLLYRLLAQLNPRSGALIGPYPNWQTAQQQSSGYDADVILEKATAAMHKVVNGEAACERDSVALPVLQHNFPVLATLQRAALENGGSLSVLDFGGSLGTSYFQSRQFLCTGVTLQWSVVEQPHIARRGQEMFAGDGLEFFEDLDSCLQRQPYDVILLSSVLQYIESPQQLLAQLAAAGAPYMIIDRTPFSLRGQEMIMVQKVPPAIYPASYPSWVFDHGRLLASLAQQYQCLADYACEEDIVGLGRRAVQYRGLVLHRGESTA